PTPERGATCRSWETASPPTASRCGATPSSCVTPSSSRRARTRERSRPLRPGGGEAGRAALFTRQATGLRDLEAQARTRLVDLHLGAHRAAIARRELGAAHAVLAARRRPADVLLRTLDGAAARQRHAGFGVEAAACLAVVVLRYQRAGRFGYRADAERQREEED